jgi:hypothetical protein
MSGQDVLLATKLHVPRPPPGFMPRPRLVQALGEGLARGRVLVCAPAGFGRHGFILTGRDLPGEDQAKAGQPVPLPLETSLPGVFAAGDVHAGSAQRVASAVGEGSVAVPQVHQHLQRPAALYRRGWENPLTPPSAP